MNPLTKIPARYRLWIYGAYFLIGVFLGACQVAGVVYLFWADTTVWLNVYAYVGLALGLTAASNVTPADTPPPAPQNNPLR